jgi:hypothetical protein
MKLYFIELKTVFLSLQTVPIGKVLIETNKLMIVRLSTSTQLFVNVIVFKLNFIIPPKSLSGKNTPSINRKGW